jgi:hypothetical protein
VADLLRSSAMAWGLSSDSPARCPLAPPGDGMAQAVAKITHEEMFMAARV